MGGKCYCGWELPAVGIVLHMQGGERVPDWDVQIRCPRCNRGYEQNSTKAVDGEIPRTGVPVTIDRGQEN